LPGCVATGKTREQVTRNMHEAIEMHVRGLREDKLPIPKSRSLRRVYRRSIASIVTDSPRRERDGDSARGAIAGWCTDGSSVAIPVVYLNSAWKTNSKPSKQCSKMQGLHRHGK